MGSSVAGGLVAGSGLGGTNATGNAGDAGDGNANGGSVPGPTGAAGAAGSTMAPTDVSNKYNYAPAERRDEALRVP
ncbi:MAG: hypothetical protein ABUL62_04130 [Myxococcales bacterium]